MRNPDWRGSVARRHGVLIYLILLLGNPEREFCSGDFAKFCGNAQKVNRAAPNAPSVIYDAVVVLGGSSAGALAKSGLAIHFLNEAYRHGKPIAAIGDGSLVLEACSLGEAKAHDGVVIGEDANAIDDLIAALLQHRFPRRLIAGVPA
jgi:catalase